jgi:hypothetical protein
MRATFALGVFFIIATWVSFHAWLELLPEPASAREWSFQTAEVSA